MSSLLLLSLMCLLSVSVSVSGGGNGMWCAVEYTNTSLSYQTNTHLSFRGTYRDFSIFVEESESDLSDCLVFKGHIAGDDGLWVIEEPSPDETIKTKNKLLSAGLPVYLHHGNSLIVGGGTDVPNVSGLDGCGADEDTSFIPVPSHTIHPPLLPESLIHEWTSLKLETNPDVTKGVESVSEDSLIFSVEALQSFQTRNSYSETIHEAQEYIVSRLTEFGFSVELVSFRPDMAENIVATWPAYGKSSHDNDSTEWVVAGAHYDSRTVDSSSPTDRAPGADDNGSGTSAMLELASIVSTIEFPANRGLKICFFSGEEQGLLGSRYLASLWSEQGVNIVGMVNADMLGYQAGDVITLGFKDKSVTPELVTLAKELTALYVPDLPTADSSSCCSDYLSFYENGYPSVGFFESGMAASDYPQYHTSSDLLQYVNTQQLKMEVQAVVATVLTLLL
eukprot:CAMPEP_0185018408 /NCGR_PEP_ID=MMETSP1103-20130426/1141_1 /TAXON_ID=36769 /ORGANISM="Paraphysomonas bandaiensis, Strain Caron Lab Isolate" /LENGTH=448 /DNA_ID=CAMNT_0027548211 /DNA_START=49 /DNA_END=1395 /DNA_ORIENTATION=-